jgi:hypothetical protein
MVTITKDPKITIDNCQITKILQKQIKLIQLNYRLKI